LFSLLFIPLSLMLFNQASPAGFFANIVAIPLLSLLILPLVLLAASLAIFDLPIADRLFEGVDWLLGLLFDYLSLLLDSGLGVYQNSNTPILLLMSASLGLLLLLLPLGKTAMKPALLLIALPLFWQNKGIDQDDFRLTVLDVGMGTSVVVETKNHSLIYDFGSGREQGFSAGEWVVKPYLSYRSIDAPDLMIISHADQDHSGGFYSFIDGVDPRRLLSGTPEETAKKFNLETNLRDCHDYPAWRWDGVDFEFLRAKDSLAARSTNNRSCVLKVSGYQSVLLSGDIEAEQEKRLLNAYKFKLTAEVLVAAHHGSLTSSTAAFVNQVLPKATVFTVGRNNRWGFPKQAVVDRFKQSGSTIYRSDHDGAVTIYSRAEGISINSYRQENHRLWNRD
ncbi:MAG: DNA internalization-related competence protein ComEC/Rec2, partial [Gammaproteobacteria bacterium]|nr:DNA internalization-related competence protein ComEC/Rec2 [Gammaproteobacteria bacterium]